MAAYGTAHEIEFSGRVPTLEWDVFLDPYLVKRVEIVLNERESFVQRQKEARNKSQKAKVESNSTDDATSKEGGDTARLSPSQPSTMPPMASANERLVLKYYDNEIRRRTEILIDRMLIAHGNVVQLVLEQTGYFKKYNFSRVKRTRKTLGGGIYAKQWLSVFAEAMKLGMGYAGDDFDTVSDSGTDGSIDEREDLDFDGDFTGRKEAEIELNDIRTPDSKSVTFSISDSMRSPSTDRPEGPPRKIVMRRPNADYEEDEDDDDDISTDGSLASETPPRRTPRGYSSPRQEAEVKPSELASPTSLHQASICPDMSISASIALLKQIVQCSAPFGLVLDMKSRHVSRRVWALVVDFLREAGVRVEGIASFFVEEVRDISQYCSTSVNEIIFFHTAGDLQLGCNRGSVKRGDRVFFNAGSLLWDYPNLYNANEVKNIIVHRFHPCFDGEDIKEGYRFKPYARTTKESSPKQSDAESETCDESTIMDDGDSMRSDLFMKLLVADKKKKSFFNEFDLAYEEAPNGICSTIQEYKEHYNLSIGLYVQEFAIDETAISLIVKYVNSNSHVYELGLSWGGINGLTVKGIQPGRFTATDGLWNQRYGGMPWNKELEPSHDLTVPAASSGVQIDEQFLKSSPK